MCFQVVSYGSGGHYEPHVDFYGQYSDERGDRIATLLYYLNDVKHGGATVFPYLGLSVQPVEGSALFWYNLKLVF
jgi:prolyl 4-hydroxylase